MAEKIGTIVLVFIGCGAAIFNGGCVTAVQVLCVAAAFGVTVTTRAYIIGGVSG